LASYIPLAAAAAAAARIITTNLEMLDQAQPCVRGLEDLRRRFWPTTHELGCDAENKTMAPSNG